MKKSPLRCLNCLALLLVLAFSTAPSLAQVPVFEFTDEADFDRPESWALKWFASASLLTSLGPVVEREPGSIELGLELIQLPSLSREERTVGFMGFKEENLNRSDVSARIRAAIGLGGKFTLALGVTPPLEVDGLEATIFNVGLERPIWQGDRGALGFRLHAQQGTAEGDFTCSDEDLNGPNLFGCEALSQDEATLDYVALELNGSYRVNDTTTLYLAYSVQEMDLEFQVDAMTFGFHDRTKIVTDGSTWSVAAGASFDLPSDLGLSVEAFYSPLDVVRPFTTPSATFAPNETAQTDELFNLRALVSYKVR